MNHLNGKYKKERGILKPLSIASMKQYELFVSRLEEGAIVEFFYEQQKRFKRIYDLLDASRKATAH